MRFAPIRFVTFSISGHRGFHATSAAPSQTLGTPERPPIPRGRGAKRAPWQSWSALATPANEGLRTCCDIVNRPQPTETPRPQAMHARALAITRLDVLYVVTYLRSYALTHRCAHGTHPSCRNLRSARRLPSPPARWRVDDRCIHLAIGDEIAHVLRYCKSAAADRDTETASNARKSIGNHSP